MLIFNISYLIEIFNSIEIYYVITSLLYFYEYYVIITFFTLFF